ncbi:MAG TPA: dienelactone hydrolase [Planctomycetes bacterium]|nr:dienelactone hydrolase [Planctomycetota bacterium]
MRSTILLLIAMTLAAVEPVVTPIDYAHDGVALRGSLAVPAGASNAAGVLVVPEWWGMNAYAERRARELAERGYISLACDMYGAGKVTEDPQVAGSWAGPFYQDRGLMVARVRAGLAKLASTPGVDAQRLSAIGFCFGGTVVLELARAGEPLRVAASFHGGLKTTTQVKPGTITARVLVFHGGSDPMVPPGEVAGFFSEMIAAKADWRFDTFGTALHAFTNPKARDLHAVLPAVDYDPAAEAASFATLHAELPRP